MDFTYDNSVEKMETEDLCSKPAGDINQYGRVREGPPSRYAKGSLRPKLQATKSFPPYSQCIGGLGEDGEWNSELKPEPTDMCQSNSNEDRSSVSQWTNTKVDPMETCSREKARVKWRQKRKKASWRSCDIDTDVWSSKRTEKSVTEKNEGEPSNNEELRKDHNSNFDKEKEKIRCPVSPENVVSNRVNTSNKNEKIEDVAETSTHRHSILSRLLHSSSTSSTCSSIISSPESDEVFSEGEDVATKRKNFKKCRSWKTYMTMMHWSLRRQSSWVQLAGHQGNFQLSHGGEVLKLHCETEAKCLDCLMQDSLRPFVPRYHGLVTRGDDCYIRLEDLLSGLRRPLIMDCKMGVRTYQEEEVTKALTKPTLRGDMYQKMVKVDPRAPSEEEHQQKGVTKLRYLQWKDSSTSTSMLGFRIEGLMMEDGSIQRDFSRIQTLTQVTEALLYFTRSHIQTLEAYHSRLLALEDALKNSSFFKTHEVIGSSLLFVHDSSKASVWMIDFGKTTPLPDARRLQHNVPWVKGSREDGYLIGLNSLITSLHQAISVASGLQEDSCAEEKKYS